MCLCVGMWMCESSYPPSQKGALDTLELEFQQLVVKLPSGCRDPSWVLCKSSCALSHRVIFQLQFYIKKILNVNSFYIAVLMTIVLFTMGVYSLSSLTLQHISTSPQVPPLHPEMLCRNDVSVFICRRDWVIDSKNWQWESILQKLPNCLKHARAKILPIRKSVSFLSYVPRIW